MKLVIHTNRHDTTTTRIKKETLTKLQEHITKYGETIDDIIQRHMDYYDKTHLPRTRNDKGQFVKRGT